MDRDGRVERVADHVDQIMVAEPPRLGEPGRVHEHQQAELLDAGEDLAEALGRQILAADIGRDLDAAEAQGFVQPVEFGDGEIGRLERHRAERHEAIRVASGDVGEVVVDDARGGDPEIGVGAVIGLVRRGRDRLDVDPHPVHVGEPIFDRGELDAVALGLLAVDLAGALVGVDLARVPRGGGIAGDHLGGLRGQHMAVNVDGEPFAAGMSRPRKPPRNWRAGRQAFEQHLRLPPRLRRY